jgi:hypothetical protein
LSRLTWTRVLCSLTPSLSMMFRGIPWSMSPLPPFYYLFSYWNIQEAIRVMNPNKVVDEEGFQVELFKHNLHDLDNHLANLFNHVVCIGFTSTSSQHTIDLIHKLGSSADPNNCRIIMVGHTLLKLYATVLHLKLSEELVWRHLRAIG